jgi:hypothetical protein
MSPKRETGSQEMRWAARSSSAVLFVTVLCAACGGRDRAITPSGGAGFAGHRADAAVEAQRSVGGSDAVIGLGSLNVIGLGGPRGKCEPMPETPTLSLSFSRTGTWPEERHVCDAIRSVAQRIETCHLDALRSHPPPPEHFFLDLFLDERGNVARPSVEASDAHSRSRLETCLAHAARKLNFGRPTSFDARLTLWFDFR